MKIVTKGTTPAHIAARTAWEVLKSKGPVNIDTVQIKVEKCFEIVSTQISPEDIRKLKTARNHALMGEGRGEWDALCKNIKV